MTQPLRFALNRMVAPHLPLADFLDLALALKIDAVELRNDLKGVEIEDGTPPEQVRELCEQRGIRLLSINALYPFDLWDEQRRQQLLHLAGYARACGAEGLVLCPLNDPGDRRSAGQRAQGLAAALTGSRRFFASMACAVLSNPWGLPSAPCVTSAAPWTRSAPWARWMC